jgi:5'-nucleotidase
MPSEPISFVFFDLDDTLLDHRGAEKRALAELYRSIPELRRFASIADLQDTYHGVNTAVWRDYSDGVINKAEASVLRFDHLLASIKVFDRALATALSVMYLEVYARFWEWLPGARDAFLAISELCSVGILTNGFAEVQRRKLAQFSELTDQASCIVISEETGYMKPDRRIFELATNRAKVKEHEILYIGDSYRSDVTGGRDAGWRVAWFLQNGEVSDGQHADLVISDWSGFDSAIIHDLSPR